MPLTLLLTYGLEGLSPHSTDRAELGVGVGGGETKPLTHPQQKKAVASRRGKKKKGEEEKVFPKSVSPTL